MITGSGFSKGIKILGDVNVINSNVFIQGFGFPSSFKASGIIVNHSIFTVDGMLNITGYTFDDNSEAISIINSNIVGSYLHGISTNEHQYSLHDKYARGVYIINSIIRNSTIIGTLNDFQQLPNAEISAGILFDSVTITNSNIFGNVNNVNSPLIYVYGLYLNTILMESGMVSGFANDCISCIGVLLKKSEFDYVNSIESIHIYGTGNTGLIVDNSTFSDLSEIIIEGHGVDGPGVLITSNRTNILAPISTVIGTSITNNGVDIETSQKIKLNDYCTFILQGFSEANLLNVYDINLHSSTNANTLTFNITFDGYVHIDGNVTIDGDDNVVISFLKGGLVDLLSASVEVYIPNGITITTSFTSTNSRLCGDIITGSFITLTTVEVACDLESSFLTLNASTITIQGDLYGPYPVELYFIDSSRINNVSVLFYVFL